MSSLCFEVAEGQVPTRFSAVHPTHTLAIAAAAPHLHHQHRHGHNHPVPHHHDHPWTVSVKGPVPSSPVPVQRRRPRPTLSGATPAARLSKGLDAVVAPRRGNGLLIKLDPAAAGSAVFGGLISASRNVLVTAGSLLQPQGDTHNDTTWTQRTVNIATSLPLAVMGLHAMGRRRTPEGRQHAASLIAVGAAAAAYHASSGVTRRILRKLVREF
jgi:hypothetical protein